jgi:hypothetical protein
MAGPSDRVFLRAFKWLKDAVAALEADIPSSGPVALATRLADALRTRLGLELNKTDSTIDPSGFKASNAQAQSLAVATLVAGEALAALKLLGQVLANLGAGTLGVDDLAKVIKQIDRIVSANPGKPPSAYSIAKLLLILSGDADEPVTKPPARRLIYLLKGHDPAGNALSDAQVAEPQMILGLAIIAVGTLLDRFLGAQHIAGQRLGRLARPCAAGGRQDQNLLACAQRRRQQANRARRGHSGLRFDVVERSKR